MYTKLQIFNAHQLFRKLFGVISLLMIFGSATAKNTGGAQLDLNLQNASAVEIFKTVEAKTGLTFVYEDDIASAPKKFTIVGQYASVEAFLKFFSGKSGYQFNKIGSTIAVKKGRLQQQPVKGKIVDKGGLPLPGASVLEKGTQNAVMTDMDGNFSINITNSPATLVVSFIGFSTKEIQATAAQTLTVEMDDATNELNEVVVTSLGIKREEKKLGFAQQTIRAESLQQTTPNNWSSALKGKVAGLNITSSGSGPLNSQQIVLRGNRSILPEKNAALVVVDGVPVTSEMTTSGSATAYMGTDSPIDYGNGISDLNLEDIESVTVLKGAGATALYGSRGANGALIITTKSGKKAKGWGVTINSGITYDKIQRWPDWQYKYGQGAGSSFDADGNPYYSYGASADGPNTGSTSSAFGPAFEGQQFFQYDPTLQGQSAERQLWQPYKDNRKDFWNTGYTLNNNVSISGGDDKGSMRLSFGHQKNEWIMPNTGFERFTVSANGNYQLSDRVKVGTSVSYNDRSSDNLPSTGYNNGSIAYFMIFQNPNVDLGWYRDIWMNGRENLDQINPFSSYIDNPYLIAYEATNSLKSYQVVGNVFSNIKISDKFELMLRAAINTYNHNREQHRPFSINRYARGYFNVQDINKREINTDFLLTYNDKFGKDFALTASVGGNAMKYRYHSTAAEVEGLVTPNLYMLTNGVNAPLVSVSDANKDINSVYGMATLTFRDYLFLDATARHDWYSSLPIHNNSLFYPSVNLSGIISEMADLGSSIDYLKYRFSWAEVGADADPYQTSKYYSRTDFPSSALAPTRLYNNDFQPEVTTSIETGFELFMLKKRLSLDATVYQSNTRNQIVYVPLDMATGFSEAVLNAGNVRNRGIELVLGGKIIDKENFEWNTTINWSRNWNKVLELADGLIERQVIGEGGTASVIATVGGTTTDIWGFGFLRSPDGQIVYDEGGLPDYPTDIEKIGNASPDWKAGFVNSIKIGNFTAGITIDGQYGGMIYSQSYHKLMEQGKLTDTYMGRENNEIIGDGVVLNPDGTYSPNTTPVRPAAYYGRYYRRANIESNSFDASFVKLREVSLGFDVPKKWLKKTGIQGMQFSVFGRDLAVISDFPLYDPETAALNGNQLLPGIEMGQMPSPASYGFNLKLNF